jgi:anthrone oxygenase-like protein
MIISTAVRVVAIACAGVLAGIYAGYGAGPQHALQALSASSFVQFQQIVHVHYVKFMPPLVLAALLAAIVWLVLIRAQWRSVEFWLIVVSACGMASIAIMTRAISLPLNDQLMTWSIDNPPGDLRTLWAPWERVNVARAYLATGVVVLETIALNLRTIPTRR